MLLLENTTAIITGAARGIGRAIANELLQNGCDVAVFDKFFPEDYSGWSAQWEANGRKVLTKQVDVTDTAAVDAACNEVAEAFGKVTILVNNAGITRDRLLVRMTEEDWDIVLKVNLKGSFNTIKALSRIMMKQRYGKIINISSIVGIIGNPGQANYAASKAGMIGLSKAVAKELATRNITVNCVAPGFVETEMTAELNADQRKALMDQIPLQRGSTPEEIAGIVAFLASPKSDYITGQVIAVDGGMAM